MPPLSIGHLDDGKCTTSSGRLGPVASNPDVDCCAHSRVPTVARLPMLSGLLPEVIAFNDFIDDHGPSGGWHEEDHAGFMDALRRCKVMINAVRIVNNTDTTFILHNATFCVLTALHC